MGDYNKNMKLLVTVIEGNKTKPYDELISYVGNMSEEWRDENK